MTAALREQRRTRRRELCELEREAAIPIARESARRLLHEVTAGCARAVGPLSSTVDNAGHQQLASARSLIEAAADLATIRSAVVGLRRCALSIVDATIAALTQERRTAQGHIEALAAVVAGFAPTDRARFDPDGAAEIDHRLDVARRHPAEPASGAGTVDELATRIREHLHAVLTARAAREDQRWAAGQAVDELSARFAALAAEAYVADIAFDPDDDLRIELAALVSAVQSGRVDAVPDAARRLAEQLDQAESTLDDLIDLRDAEEAQP